MFALSRFVMFYRVLLCSIVYCLCLPLSLFGRPIRRQGLLCTQHLEFERKHEGGSVWDLWKAIEALHVQKDASLRHEAWMHLFGHRKRPDESYIDYFRRGDSISSRIERITPTTLSSSQLISELLRFAHISGLPSDDPLRRQLVSQRNVTLDDVYAAFQHTDTDAKAATEVESANAAFILRCYRSLQTGQPQQRLQQWWQGPA